MRKILILFSLSTIVGCSLFSKIQNNNSDKIRVEIKQFIGSASSQNEFVILKDRLIIYENKVTTAGLLKSKKIFSRRLNRDEINKLNDIIKPLLKLKFKYVKAKLGGIRWELNITSNKSTKEIVIENSYVSEVNALFNAINSLIYNNKYKLHLPLDSAPR